MVGGLFFPPGIHAIYAHRCVRLGLTCRPHIPKKRGRPLKLHKPKSHMELPASVDFSPRPLTQRLSSGAAADIAAGVVRLGCMSTPASSPPLPWDLRSMYLSISSFSAIFSTMVDAGEVQRSRVVPIMWVQKEVFVAFIAILTCRHKPVLYREG